jgi:hypothetical protein
MLFRSLKINPRSRGTYAFIFRIEEYTEQDTSMKEAASRAIGWPEFQIV